ncbi:MAG TPA: undecaprenyl-phosphate glucose phosphotransferase [Beijerinckiaceae bacterium]|mgnify:CR=1 FL=1|nr:undecaprenyl-phosphate glucose phosphotransferase [Beijerinckiaceae bacterium]
MNAHVKIADVVDEVPAAGQPEPPAVAVVHSPAVAPDIRLSQPMVIGTVLATDVVMLLAGGLASEAMIGSGWNAGPVVSLGLAMAAVICLLHQRFFGYTIASFGSAVQQILRFGGAMVSAFAALVTFIVIMDSDVGSVRGWFIGWAALAFGVIACGRIVLARQVGRWTEQGRLARRAVIVGGGRPVEDLLASLARDGSRSIDILGLFDDRGGERSPDQVDTYHKLGRFDELVAFCRDHRVDLLIITLPHVAEARILHLLKKLWVLPIDIRISAVGAKLKLRPRAYTYIGKTPFLAVFDKPLTDWGIAVKAVEDRVLAGLILVLLAPVMLAVALAVKLTSKGPVLFKQTRYGFNNEKIGVYKFRSMYVDQCDANAVKLVTKGDPRVTKVGAFIRKTSLDELPQLINVLKGELSIVGPRPHAMQAKAGGQIYDEVVEGYFARHKVKPGITGWAQINGWRGETDTEEKIQRRVEYDLQYIDNWSVFFDLYILAMTPVSLINTKNAY